MTDNDPLLAGLLMLHEAVDERAEEWESACRLGKKTASEYRWIKEFIRRLIVIARAERR